MTSEPRRRQGAGHATDTNLVDESRFPLFGFDRLALVLADRRMFGRPFVDEHDPQSVPYNAQSTCAKRLP